MEVNVLIVGAGPTGLTLANELARQGVSFYLMDKMEKPNLLSKAIAIQARTLELLTRFPEALNEFLSEGIKLEEGKIFSQNKLLAEIDFRKISSPYAFVLSLPQTKTEEILREQLSFYNKEVNWGNELVTFCVNDSNKIIAHIRTASGEEKNISCQYLAACDGAHSAIRKKLQLPFIGSTFTGQQFMLADVLLNKNLPENKAQIFLNSGRILAIFPLGNNRFRLIVEKPKTNENPMQILEVEKLLQEMVAKDLIIKENFWFSEFNINQRKINQYSVDSIFFLGDAAHIHSPVGGQGMNTGIQDAINLGWKLAAVIKNNANEKILSTYSEEREVVAKTLLEATNFATRMTLVKNKFFILLRDFLLKNLLRLNFIRKKILAGFSELNINYKNSSLTCNLLKSKNSIQAGYPWPNEKIDNKCWYDLFSCDYFNLIIVNADQKTYQALSSILSVFAHRLRCFSVQNESINVPSYFTVINHPNLESLFKIPAIYLVRPDRYLAFTGNIKDIKSLERFLKSWL